MSKKDRLKAQKEKQTLRQRELEEEERLAKEEAKEKKSKAVAKMQKKAKRQRRRKEPLACLFLKILMIIPFGYSAFFYGGVTVTAIFLEYIEPVPPKWVAYAMIAGAVLIGSGIILAFFRKYIISFSLVVGGTLSFLKGGNYIISKIQEGLAGSPVDPALEEMDKQYMIYYYPIIAAAVISMVLLIIYIIRAIRNKKRIQHEKDTAPVKSIVEN